MRSELERARGQGDPCGRKLNHERFEPVELGGFMVAGELFAFMPPMYRDDRFTEQVWITRRPHLGVRLAEQEAIRRNNHRFYSIASGISVLMK